MAKPSTANEVIGLTRIRPQSGFLVHGEDGGETQTRIISEPSARRIGGGRRPLRGAGGVVESYCKGSEGVFLENPR